MAINKKIIEDALVTISRNLTTEMKSIITDRGHINTGLLLNSIIVEAGYNPKASKNNFVIVYNAPYYWQWVDLQSAEKNTTTCTQALKQSAVYNDSVTFFKRAIEEAQIPTDQTGSAISDLIGTWVRVQGIKSIIKAVRGK